MKERAAFIAPPALLVVVSLSTSLFLVPDEREMALMHYKAKQFEIARGLYQQLAAKGDLSVAVVKPLSELHLQFGDVDEAVALLERFVETEPSSIDALRKLGVFYQYAQRPEEYRRNLEVLSELQLSEEALRELSQIYSAEARIDEQIEVLTLLTQRFPTLTQDFLDLTYLEARKGRPLAALEALEHLADLRPEAIDEQVKELQLNLLLDVRESERAFHEASRFLARSFSFQSLSRLVALFELKGQSALALELIRPYEDKASAYPPLVAQFAHLLISNGNDDDAYALLRTLSQKDRLPSEAKPVLVELALARGETELAFETLADHDLGSTPEWLLEGVVSASVASPDRRFARRLVERLHPDFLDSHPLLAAELFESTERPALAMDWALRAEQAPKGAADSLRLSYLFERLQTPERALTVLETLERTSGLAADARMSLARLYVQLQRAEEGLPRFRDYRARDSRAAGAWALLEAAAGDGAAVKAWLERETPATATDSLVTELFFVATNRRDADLALTAARTLHHRDPVARDRRMYLARALLSASRVVEALNYSRALMPGSPDEESVYHDALSAAWRTGEVERGELSRYLLGRLADSNLSDQTRRELVSELVSIRDSATALDLLGVWTRDDPDTWIDIYTETAVAAGEIETLVPFLEELLSAGKLSLAGREIATSVFVEHGNDETSLPHLRGLAETVGKHWVYLYDGALSRLGRRSELESLWTERAARTDLSLEDKRATGYRLLELELDARAIAVFFDLAKDARGQSADVSEYLYLAVESEDPSVVSWVEGRARRARGEERAAWMRHLIFLESPHLAAALVAARPLEELSEPVLDAYVESLSASRDVAELTRLVDWSLRHETDPARLRRLGREADPTRLRRLGRLAFEGDALAAADRAFETIVRLAPDDRGAQRELGLIAFMRSDYERAGEYLERFLSSGPSDHETDYYYGEVLLREGEKNVARVHYRNALERIDSLEKPGPAERAVRAQLLHRLDRSEESFAEFESLIALRPEDAHLLADYVAARLERDDFAEARKALDGADSARGPGQLRLALLDANLLARTQKEEQAVEKLEGLRGTYPDNATVVAALASAKNATGRWREALSGFDAALVLDPNNEEFRRARESTWNLGAPELGGEWAQRIVGDEQRQTIATVSGHHRFGPALKAGIVVRRSDASTSVPFADGGRHTLSATRQHAELSARIDTESGLWYRGALHVLRGGAGASFELNRPRAGRNTQVKLDFRAPYWDIMYGSIDDARRDRVLVGHSRTLSRRVHALGSTSLQRYGSAGVSGLARSIAASGALTLTARIDNPQVSFQYLFDAEYFREIDRRHDTSGRPLSSVFLASREVHAPGAIVSGAFLDHFRGDGFAGYSWDRLGGRSPYFGFRLHYELPEGFVARAFFERRLYRLDTALAENYWGAELFWRF